MHVYVCVCMYVCGYVCIHMYVYIPACTLCLLLCLHLCLCVSQGTMYPCGGPKVFSGIILDYSYLFFALLWDAWDSTFQSLKSRPTPFLPGLFSWDPGSELKFCLPGRVLNMGPLLQLLKILFIWKERKVCACVLWNTESGQKTTLGSQLHPYTMWVYSEQTEVTKFGSRCLTIEFCHWPRAWCFCVRVVHWIKVLIFA